MIPLFPKYCFPTWIPAGSEPGRQAYDGNMAYIMNIIKLHPASYQALRSPGKAGLIPLRK